jgi:hypothetical protein
MMVHALTLLFYPFQTVSNLDFVHSKGWVALGA